jgi:hypothetical protein
MDTETANLVHLGTTATMVMATANLVHLATTATMVMATAMHHRTAQQVVSADNMENDRKIIAPIRVIQAIQIIAKIELLPVMGVIPQIGILPKKSVAKADNPI